MKYKDVRLKMKYRLLPFVLSAALVYAPVTAYAAWGRSESTETVDTETDAKSEEPAPAPDPDPAPAQDNPPPAESSDSGDSTAASSEESGGSEETGNEGGDTSGQSDEGENTGDSNDTGETGASSGEESDPADPDAPSGDDLSGGEGEEPGGEQPGEETGGPEATAEEQEILQPDEETELPEGAELADEYSGSNDELIASQHIVSLPARKDDFRFFSMDGTAAVLKEDSDIYEEKSTKSKKVGKAGKLCSVTILEEEGKWAYVEAGTMRGFVPRKRLAVNKEKEALLANRENIKNALNEKIELLNLRIRENKALSFGLNPRSLYALILQKDAAVRELKQLKAEEKETATALVPWYENDAFLYLRGTSQKHVAEKKYALAADSVAVHEEKSLASRAIGSAQKGALLYILQSSGSWYYVESGNVRGYVRASDLETGKEISEKVKKQKEDSFPTALLLIKPADNHALYDTIYSVTEGTKENPIRRQILELAEKSIGHPYVWGGTDLYNGADCSGFVQSLYRAFGYNIPRVAAAQAQYGTQIPVEDAEPGDLIFFARNGYVYHVAMYWGDGVTIEAYSSGRGITQVANVYARDAVWATRILD